jgi:hypothetical protein
MSISHAADRSFDIPVEIWANLRSALAAGGSRNLGVRLAPFLIG